MQNKYKFMYLQRYTTVNKNDTAGQETNSQQQSLKLRAGIMKQPWPNNSTKQKIDKEIVYYVD